ncbi:hypothetical protein C826_01838 [Helicobacter bilis WiWa]|uniref:MORN repeat variant n=1 Tax=Helicobacter bilis WiWa TaxID=1235804 RepID=N2BGV4_9HELI|nr:hypothetical protein [Helicobacter bilis]EMZ37758.1 hypothetical protein C826_01838 [Helicobacter bilis WiWa]
MLLKSVLMGFLSLHSVDTTMLKECENHADKISGCVEREYYSNGKIYWETPFKNGGREGIEKWYYENGNLNTQANKRSKKHYSGLFNAKHSNPSIKSKMQCYT